MNKRRKQILDAAHQLFIEKGFSLTSIQDILDKAGVAKGTFYNYFNSKNECLLAILDYITEEINRERREIAIGKEANDEEVFIKQMIVRLNANRQHHLFTVFNSISFSEEIKLREFMSEQYRNELSWVTNRIQDIYPTKAKAYAIDHAVMIVGIIHHMIHVWKLESSRAVPTEKIVRYALSRLKDLLDSQMEDEELFFRESWIDTINPNQPITIEKVNEKLKEIDSKISKKDAPKQKDMIEFLITELSLENPRIFLLEGVLLSLEKSFLDTELEHEVRQLVKFIWDIIQT